MSIEGEIGSLPGDAERLRQIAAGRWREELREQDREQWSKQSGAYYAIRQGIVADIEQRAAQIDVASLSTELLELLKQQALYSWMGRKLPGSLGELAARIAKHGDIPFESASTAFSRGEALYAMWSKYFEILCPPQPPRFSTKPRSEADANRNPE